MPPRLTHATALALYASLMAASVPSLHAQDLKESATTTQYATSIKPLIQQYCLDCHSGSDPEAKLDLGKYQTHQQVTDGLQTWSIVLERIEAGDMPPADNDQPSSAERELLASWIKRVRRNEAERNAGDPGPVLVRRLNNAEYNYSIRDLTGVDIRPTQTFPIDPANEAGFDNSGESLTMSPALLNKYLSAARLVSEHLVLKPDGIAFAPHPVATETDRDKYCVKRIVEFYNRQPTQLTDYFFAAWRYRCSLQQQDRNRSLSDHARAQSVSAQYLQRVWDDLSSPEWTTGPMSKLQSMWRDLPNDPRESDIAQARCARMSAYVTRIRARLQPTFPNITVPGSHKGSQPFVLWKNDQYAAARQSYDPESIISEANSDDSTPRELIEPDDDQGKIAYRREVERFCSTFPDAFYVSERGRDYLDKPREQQEKGRLLSAGFHSMMGYYRDDQPLYDLILNEAGREELDRLWDELNFVTGAPQRQYSGFLWFERTDSRYMRDPQFDFARAEDRAAANEEMIHKLAEVYIAKARANGGQPVSLRAIATYFKNVNRQIRWVETSRTKAEPSHVDSLVKFAARAYRRPLSSDEQNEIRDYYRQLRAEDKLPHEEAIQDTLVSILMSPYFSYRLDLGGLTSGQPEASGPTTEDLSDFELASRLSYFLWSSLPDEELLDTAANGTLRQSDVLREQTRRMLKDDRIRGMAIEFAGQWLDFRRFQQHNSVDRNRFPQFTDELRASMFEEPVRYFVDIAQSNAPITEFIYGRHTFVNAELARHYGMPTSNKNTREWSRVDDATIYGRGGLLSMAVFLTYNSPGLRTSPVKRGYWVVRRILGERIPAPPPNVPELPADEGQLGDLTLRELLARHREHPSCAGCHARFDALGLVFEEYGPVGERRQLDLGGRPVNTQAIFPDGKQRAGITGLREYLRKQRDHDFIDHFCRQLLAYSLNRTLQLSDDLLLEEMKRQLEDNEFRIVHAVETIVLSPQFRQRRAFPRQTAGKTTSP